MRIHLAGHGATEEMIAPMLVRWKLHRLQSYWYLRTQTTERSLLTSEHIVDSGLFSLMFGAEKGSIPSTLEAYRAYTLKYIEDLNSWGYDGLFVESDTHRLLGMDATYKLRELFTPLGQRVIYVWHKPEGLDGLERLALERDYIALSVPELRGIASRAGNAGGTSNTRMVKELLVRIHAACRKAGKLPPRIHLLGCTVPDQMETSAAWSCDSTSWISGVRYGKAYVYGPNPARPQGSRLRIVQLRSEANRAWVRALLDGPEGDAVRAQAATYKNQELAINVFSSMYAFAMYQQALEARFTAMETRWKQQ